MGIFHICCIIIGIVVFALANIVEGGEPADDRTYDDEDVEINPTYFQVIYDLATKLKRKKHEYAHPYIASDYEKLATAPIPNRFKQRLVDDFERYVNEIKMTPTTAAHEALRYASEDLMDIYQGRLNSMDDMTKLMKIRRTDPVRFLAYMGQHDQQWFKANAHKQPGKGDKPTFKLFRELVRKYYIANPTTKSRLIEI